MLSKWPAKDLTNNGGEKETNGGEKETNGGEKETNVTRTCSAAETAA